MIKLLHETFLMENKMKQSNRLVICMVFGKYIMQLQKDIDIIIF